MSRARRRCAACGHPAKPGDPLRPYRVQRRYPQPTRRMARYEVLRVHKSHLTGPASGLYRGRP